MLGGAAAGIGLIAVAALLPGHSGDRRPTAAVDVVARPAAPAAPPAAIRRPARRFDDPAATAYLRLHARTPARHVERVVRTGEILRVYTDLPGSAANSRAATGLCEAAASYLHAQGRPPMVFVHARRRDGYPVLANRTGEHDDCRLNAVP